MSFLQVALKGYFVVFCFITTHFIISSISCDGDVITILCPVIDFLYDEVYDFHLCNHLLIYLQID